MSDYVLIVKIDSPREREGFTTITNTATITTRTTITVITQTQQSNKTGSDTFKRRMITIRQDTIAWR
jgi:hypothetical protein